MHTPKDEDKADVWPRFERLAQCCKIVVDHGPLWRVDVRQKNAQESIVTTGPDLLTAVKEALDQAEKRGWHKPNAKS